MGAEAGQGAALEAGEEAEAEAGAAREGLEQQVWRGSVGLLQGKRSLVCGGWWRVKKNLVLNQIWISELFPVGPLGVPL